MFTSVNLKISLTKYFDWLYNDIVRYFLVNYSTFCCSRIIFDNLIINTSPYLCGTSFSHPEEWKRYRHLASKITLRSWKVVYEPHIKGISGNIPNIDPVLFLNQMKDEGSAMIMIPWKSVLKYLNCLKFTKDGKNLILTTL